MAFRRSILNVRVVLLNFHQVLNKTTSGYLRSAYDQLLQGIVCVYIALDKYTYNVGRDGT